MEKRYTDRVIAVEEDHRDEVALRLADWTPNGGYTALVEAADGAGLDLSELSDGDVVGRATVTEDGDVTHFSADPDCDHSDTRRLGSHPESDGTWPVVFDEKPKSGLTQQCRCIDCGEDIKVVYRVEEIRDSDGDLAWSRGE